MLPNLETRGLLPVQSPVPSFSKYGRLAGTENSVFNFYNLLSKSIKKVVGWLLYFQKVAWFGAMRIESIHIWRWIGTEWNWIIVYSSNNNKITHSYTPTNSNIVEAFASRPPYTHYSPSKIQTMMACHAGMVLTRCCQKETTYQVVSCSSSKFTLNVFYYQRQGKGNNWTEFSVCFDTSRILAR